MSNSLTHSDAGAAHAGARRGRRHEREYRARAHDLSQADAGAGVGNVALVVATAAAARRRSARRSSPSRRGAGCSTSTFRSGWWRRAGARGAADDAAPRSKLDCVERRAQCGDLRLTDRRRRRARQSRCPPRRARACRGLAAGALLTWRQFGLALPVLPIDLLRRPVFALSMVLRSPRSPRRASPSSRCRSCLRRAAPIGDRDGPADDAVAARHRADRADRGASGRPFSAGLLASAGLVVLASVWWPPFDARGAALVDIVWRLGVCGLGSASFRRPTTR